MLMLPMRILNVLSAGAVPVPGQIRSPATPVAWSVRPSPLPDTQAGTTGLPEQFQLDLIRSYASSGFAAVIAINSGALIASLSQTGNLLEILPPPAIALAALIWAVGVTAGVATWGAAYRAVVALAASDQDERRRWRGIAGGLFHLSLGMFLLGFIILGVALAA
jgi:hypothetical protein